MKNILLLLFVLFSYLGAFSTYTVTIPPHKFFLENIGQSKIKIKAIYENIDYTKAIPHSHFRKLAYSDTYFTIGLPIEEEYIKNIRDYNDEIEVIDTSKNIQKELYNGNPNPYIWLDPLSVREICEVMLKVLIKNDPANKEYFESNYNTFIGELDKIFLRIRNALFYSKNAVFVYDEKWDYYLKRFDQKYFRAENKILSGLNFTKINRLSREENIKYILVDKSIDYEVYKSWSNANNIEIIQVDIFSYDWLSDLFILSEKISKEE